MKSCPSCKRTYPDDTLAFCLVDGSILSAPYGPEETQSKTRPRDSRLAPTELLGSAAISETNPAPQSTILAAQPILHGADQPSLLHKRPRKKLWLALGASISVLILFGISVYLFLPTKSLGVYKGSLVELFPKSIAGFQLSSSGQDHRIRQQLNAADAWLAVYHRESTRTALGLFDFVTTVRAQSIEEDRLVTMAFNFSSIESAKDGLQNLRKLLGDATVVEQGSKRKGVATVGERLVLIPHNDLVRHELEKLHDGASLVRAQSSSVIVPKNKVVIWTNGSVLFFVQGEGNTALEIEGSFVY